MAQAEGELEAVRSQVPGLNTDLQAAIHRLGVLLGKEPGELEEELLKQAAVPPAPPEVPTGIPSDLLERRPDGRVNRLFLTEQGKRVHDEVVPKHDAMLAAYFNTLPAEEQHELVRLLRRVDRAMERD